MPDFYICVDEHAEYPDAGDGFSPDTAHPEYRWGSSHLSRKKNDIYNMVRDCLIGLRMDTDNLGTRQWNPLGALIRKGDTVLVKPNWVMHSNENKHVTDNNLECLITHPSVVRAIVDYCLIALNGTGRIIVGDAPLQGCDLDRLLASSGYNELFGFYQSNSIDLIPTDFRGYSALQNSSKVIIGKKYNLSRSTEVALDSQSRFAGRTNETIRYKVSDYDHKATNTHHRGDTHTYLINQDALSADVVINVSKPKCHRLAGVTASMKNYVGITYDKACLPHRTAGSQQEGGDEYLNKSRIKALIGCILDKKIKCEEQNKHVIAIVLRYVYGMLYYLMRAFSKDRYLLGSWYGNDTIWRTVADLYHILLYADKQGRLAETRQRREFNIADMIVAGERNGPVKPQPKRLGVIIAGYDSVPMDKLVCDIMGFDHRKVPSIYNSMHDSKLIHKGIAEYTIDSNLTEYQDKRIDELSFPRRWHFQPHDAWKGKIEKQ